MNEFRPIICCMLQSTDEEEMAKELECTGPSNVSLIVIRLV